MEPIFATDRTRELLPKIKTFIEKELYPLETPNTSPMIFRT